MGTMWFIILQAPLLDKKNTKLKKASETETKNKKEMRERNHHRKSTKSNVGDCDDITLATRRERKKKW